MKKIIALIIICLTLSVSTVNSFSQSERPTPTVTSTPIVTATPTSIPSPTATPTPLPPTTTTPEPVRQISRLIIIKAGIGFNDGKQRDRFAINGMMALHPDSDGIDPANEDIRVVIGSSSITIPAGSLTDRDGAITMVLGSSSDENDDAKKDEDLDDADKGRDKDRNDKDGDSDSDDEGKDKEKDSDNENEDSDDDRGDNDRDKEDDEGGLKFKGSIDDAHVLMEIKETDIETYKFKVEAEKVDLTGTANPLGIEITVGNDTWKAVGVKFNGELKFISERDKDENDKSKDKDVDEEDDGDGDHEDKGEERPSNTVVIDGCDTGVEDKEIEDGFFISDLIEQCAEAARNRGQFISCVANRTNNLKNRRIIDPDERSEILACSVRANIDNLR